MLEIERVSLLNARYAVRLDQGSSGVWERRRFKEMLTGDIDGEPYRVEPEGRKRFVLMHSGLVLARADAGKRGRRTIAAGDSSYELRRRSAWRSEMELSSGGVTVGSIRKAGSARGGAQCELPNELSLPAQVFVGLLVLMLWKRAAAAAAAAS